MRAAGNAGGGKFCGVTQSILTNARVINLLGGAMAINYGEMPD